MIDPRYEQLPAVKAALAGAAADQLSSIGHNNAVAEIFGIKLSGLIAWLMWRGLHLLRVPTFARKTRLFLEWNWAMFFPPDICHLGYRRTQRRARTPAIGTAATEPKEAVIRAKP